MMEFNLSQYIDNLLSACIPNPANPNEEKECKNNFTRISGFLDENMLKGTQFIIYKIISRSYYNSTKISWEYVRILTEQNARRFIRDEHVEIKTLFPDVRITELEDIQKERQLIGMLMNAVQLKYDLYSNTLMTLEDVNTSLDILRDNLRLEELKKVFLEANQILFEGKTVKRQGTTKFLCGIDAMEFATSEIGKLATKYSTGSDHVEEIMLDSYESYEYLRDSNTKSYRKVADIGIAPIDEATDGIHTTQIVGLQGISGVGKSRLAFRINYRALTLYGSNCYYYGREQHCAELEAYLPTQHLWNTRGVYIDDKQVKKHSEYLKSLKLLNEQSSGDVPNSLGSQLDLKPVLTEEEEKLLEEARIDIYSNPNYGTIYLDNSFTPVEKLANKITTIHTSKLKIDLLTIDHMSILPSDGSLNGGQIWGKTEIVSNGMLYLKNLAQQLDLAVIAINQMTRDEVDSLLDGHKARITGGANSSEFEHSSDMLFTIGTTEQLDEVDKVFIDIPKLRDSRKIGRLILNTSKGVCEFVLSEVQGKN